MPAHLTVALTFKTLQLAVRLELFPVRDHQRCRKLTLSTYQHHLVHEARGFNRLFDRLRRDVLATGSLEQLLLAIRNAQEAVLIDRADVAGLEPAVAREHGSRLVRLVVITAHHVWTTHFDLAVFGNANVDVRNCFTNRADAIVFDPARGDDGRRLSQAITLDNRNAGADVDVRKFLWQSSATGNQQSQASAKRALPL